MNPSLATAVTLAPRRRLNTAQIARRYQRSEKTVRRWIKAGLLVAYVTNEANPQSQRYECDETQLDEFERSHWRRTDGAPQLAGPAIGNFVAPAA